MRGLSQFPPLWILLHKPPHQSPSVPASPQGEAFILAHRHKPIPEPPDYPGVFFIQEKKLKSIVFSLKNCSFYGLFHSNTTNVSNYFVYCKIPRRNRLNLLLRPKSYIYPVVAFYTTHLFLAPHEIKHQSRAPVLQESNPL